MTELSVADRLVKALCSAVVQYCVTCKSPLTHRCLLLQCNVVFAYLFCILLFCILPAQFSLRLLLLSL